MAKLHRTTVDMDGLQRERADILRWTSSHRGVRQGICVDAVMTANRAREQEIRASAIGILMIVNDRQLASQALVPRSRTRGVAASAVTNTRPPGGRARAIARAMASGPVAELLLMIGPNIGDDKSVART